MPLIFIPVTDYSTDATAASAQTDDVYLGILQLNQALTHSFRIGNNSASAVTFTWEVSDEFDADVADHLRLLLGGSYIDLADPITLAPGQCTDTVGLFLERGVDAGSRYYLPVLSVVSTTGDVTSLEMAYDTVGPHSYKRRQYPDSATNMTDAFSGVIHTFSEPLVLHRYDPIQYDPEDTSVWVNHNSISGQHTFESSDDPCQRLKPDNDLWGYDHNESIFYASFQAEDYDVRLNFTQDNTEMQWTGTARLYIPAEYDMLPVWGLFALESGADQAQFKRTVWLTQRRGLIYYLANLTPQYRGAELAYHESDLIALHDSAMGSPDFFNPFALTYEFNSDKPYQQHPCRLGMFITSLTAAQDTSGSLAQSDV